MKASERFITTLSNEVVRLENKVEELEDIIRGLESESKRESRNAYMYRENCLEWKNSTKELQDFIANMLMNIGEDY
jgi:predicted RNase H-like nuclease (RuvC/YqgF family)